MQKIYFIAALLVMILFCGIMLVDRHILNHSYNKISDVINTKETELQLQQQRHNAEIEALNNKLQIRQEQFHIIMPYRSLESKTQEAGQADSQQTAPTAKEYNHEPLTQYDGEPELLALAKELAAQIDENSISSENIIKVFREMPESRLGKTIFYNTAPLSKQLINIRAALLEALCAHFGYKCETVFCWDMNTMEHFFQATVSSSRDLLDRTTYSSSSNSRRGTQQHVITQKVPVSVLLPFQPIELNERDECMLMSDIHQVPVGGLYLHRIDVVRHPESRAKEWILEYRFKLKTTDEEKKRAFFQTRLLQCQTQLSAISLIPGDPLESCISDGVQSFRIPFINGKSSILIVGDLPVLPTGITAYSVVE